MKLNEMLKSIVSPRIHGAAVCLVLLIHGILLGWIAVVNSPIADEIAHLPSGLSHWRFGNFDLYRVNPPLMRMIAALPLLIADPKTDWAVHDGPYSRPEFEVGLNFMAANGYDSFWLFTIARWAQIPISIFGGWICYRWARELSGESCGLVALILWCFCPNVLTWGATITPDLGATVFGAAAGYAFWHWLKTPTWQIALLAGLSLGVAELSKSTWIVLFGLWPLLWIVWRCCRQTEMVTKPPAVHLACILFLGIYFLNCGYGFENSFQPLGEFKFVSRTFGGAEAHTTPSNCFHDTWLETIPVPVPANYLKGIDIQRYDFERPRMSYLRGEFRTRGWYYYYLYGLAVKTPLGTLSLIALAIVLTTLWRKGSPTFRDEIILLMPAIAILFLVSSQTGFNKHVRYVLPAIPYLYIFSGRVGRAFVCRNMVPRVLCVLCVIATMVGSLSVYPHSMSYFNSVAGGPRGGPFHLLNTNIDCGQDLLELKRFIDRHPEVTPIKLAFYGLVDPSLAGFPFERLSPSHDESTEFHPKPGWFAISVNYLHGYQEYDAGNQALTRFQRLTPDAMAGYSIYLYRVTAEKSDQLRKPL